MNENTPSTNKIRYGWAAFRFETSGVSSDASMAEFDRWLAAHDQGIWDAAKPPAMTAREHLEAAFEAAYPVQKWRGVPVGVTIIARRENGKIWVLATGLTSGAYDNIEVRTLEPLPPVIPDDCNAVWASTRENGSRRVWVRANGGRPGRTDEWDDGDRDTYYEQGANLINPVPVPEEQR